MEKERGHLISRRSLLKAAGAGAAGLGLSSLPTGLLACSRSEGDDSADPGRPPQDGYFPPSELEGVPNDLYMSRGHNLNHSYVIPSLDLVVVRQGNQNRQLQGEPSFATALVQKIVASIP